MNGARTTLIEDGCGTGLVGAPSGLETSLGKVAGWSTRGLAAALLVVHAALLGLSLPRNSVTIDEVFHLPAGISYWHHGRFWCYHHNPPLIRLLCAVPSVLADVPTDYRHYQYIPGSRAPDIKLGRDFMRLNRPRYLLIYLAPRAVVSILSVFGGYLVFLWSRALFGDAGGLISLSLWVFCPNILAHAALVTPDVGGTVVGLCASYLFWRYLGVPAGGRAALCGVFLGLAQASKFSMVILPLAWVILIAVKLGKGRWDDGVAARLSPGRALIHAAICMTVALIVLNDVYLAEGTGRRLDSFDFRSRMLTRAVGPGRENLFRGTAFGPLPAPLPEHYLLGIDDQSYDVDSAGFYKYLRGELRHREPGWFHYYAYCGLVKTPLGTLALLAAGCVAAFATRRCRADALSELSLGLPAVLLFVLVSSQRGLNSHFRYILPAFPFGFIAAGRLGPLCRASRRWALGVAAALVATAGSTLAVHPHYLTYFNEAAGGPDRGLKHLADSNVDWGQGLIALRDWLARNAPGRPIRLAYYGVMDPEILDIAYELAPFGPGAGPGDPRGVGPVPGLQAVSGNFLIGIPFSAPNGHGSLSRVPPGAYLYYSRFRPVAIVGHSIYVYDISKHEANRARVHLGLPTLSE